MTTVFYGAGLLLLPLTGAAQNLVITGGVHTYNALTNAVVTMTGRAELRLMAASAPLSGCVIHLNSADAWLVLPNIQPSVVVSSYVSQVRVNGSVAIADGNVRAVQYGMGTVIIPHLLSMQPLQVFSGPHFTGGSVLLSQYAAYNGAGLGVMNQAISSFKLKRGYMATVAENENGTGASECYVAQEADLEVSLLPERLDDKIRFVRVFPWRWISKKGVAGNIWQNLNVQWYYNWNLNQNSSRDVEYVAIRQTQWWPGLSQDWRARAVNHLLGFNEPDSASQANMTVTQAIDTWPTLLATGLRVGAPAVTDGGASWLYDFIDQADAAGLRVDFVPVHYYRCYSNPANADGTATQFYNFLKSIYDRVKRPLWVTEWNNGANWTTCTDPTFAQQEAAVAKMIEMLDNTPFVERYAIYNWVEDVRRVQWDDGSLTQAGVVYRDIVSPVAYVQALPGNGSRGIAQFRFENNTLDGSGFGNNAVAVGLPIFSAGRVGQAIDLDGVNSHLRLPPDVASGAGFTFAAWVNWDGGGNWQRIFDFGNDTSHYLFLTPSSGSGTLRFAVCNGGTEQRVETSALQTGQWRHVAVTLGGNTARLYLDGEQVAFSSSFSILPSSFKPQRNFLGESQFTADPLFNGRLDEVFLADYALTPTQVAGLLTNLPPQFASATISRPNGLVGNAYNGTISGSATDPNPGDTLTYSKVRGPAWLSVNANGALAGTPGPDDGGTNTFVLRVVDQTGASAFCVLTIFVANPFSNGTWIADANGSWSTPGFWSGGTVADGAGFTADFSTINITGDRTVTLDSPRSLGTLKFGDVSGNQAWMLHSAGAVLTLDTLGANQPTIVVTNTVTLNVPIAGTNGLLKTGPGTLVLSGNSSLSGTLNVDSSNTTWNEGAVRLASSSALGTVSLIQIRNNNNGSSTLQLDGAAGPLNVGARLAVSCRNVNFPTILNLAGTNVLSGFIGLDVGGSLFVIQSDAGLLVMSGVNQYVGSLPGGRSYVFTGAGDHLVSGPIRNSTNGAPISLVKNGSGTLTLNGVNTYAGSTVLSEGALVVKGALTAAPVTVSNTATLAGSGTLAGEVVVSSGGTISPGASASGLSIANLTVNNNLVLQAGSVTRMQISKSPLANDRLVVTGVLNCAGTLEVTNVSGVLGAGDNFIIFETGSTTGAFDGYVLPSLSPGLEWDTSGLSNGEIRVIQPLATTSTNITVAVIENSLAVSWPATHVGWQLQVQTNGLGTNWSNVPGSDSVSEWILPVDRSLGSIYLRLARPDRLLYR